MFHRAAIVARAAHWVQATRIVRTHFRQVARLAADEARGVRHSAGRHFGPTRRQAVLGRAALETNSRGVVGGIRQLLAVRRFVTVLAAMKADLSHFAYRHSLQAALVVSRLAINGTVFFRILGLAEFETIRTVGNGLRWLVSIPLHCLSGCLSSILARFTSHVSRFRHFCIVRRFEELRSSVVLLRWRRISRCSDTEIEN